MKFLKSEYSGVYPILLTTVALTIFRKYHLNVVSATEIAGVA